MKDTSNLPASFGLSSWFLTQWRSPYNTSKQEEDCTGNYILPTNHGFPLHLLRYMRTGSIVRMEGRLRLENEEKVWPIIVPYPTVCSDSPSSLQIPHLLQLSPMHLTAAATASGLPNPPSIGGFSQWSLSEICASQFPQGLFLFSFSEEAQPVPRSDGRNGDGGTFLFLPPGLN